MTTSDPVEQARAWLEEKTGQRPPDDSSEEAGAAGSSGSLAATGFGPVDRSGVGGVGPRRSTGTSRSGAARGSSAWGASGSGLSSAESGRAAFVPHATGSRPSDDGADDPGEATGQRTASSHAGGSRSDRSRGGASRGGAPRGGGSRRRRSSARRSFGVGATEPDDGPPEPDADPVGTARTIALRKLTASARTRHELDEALQKKNVPEEIAAAVLDRLEDVGLIDDGAFAQSWVDSRQQRRHLSRSALRRELQTKGVDRDQVDAALASVDVEDELAAARALAAKKAAGMHGLDRTVRERRLAGVLARRGFGSGIVTTVLRELRDTDGA